MPFRTRSRDRRVFYTDMAPYLKRYLAEPHDEAALYHAAYPDEKLSPEEADLLSRIKSHKGRFMVSSADLPTAKKLGEGKDLIVLLGPLRSDEEGVWSPDAVESGELYAEVHPSERIREINRAWNQQAPLDYQVDIQTGERLES